jgi:hypothetical protein
LTRSGVTGAALAFVVFATIASEVAGLHWAALPAAAALSVYVLGQWPNLPRTGRTILVAAVATGIAAMTWVDHIDSQLMRAARTACYYATLFTAVGFLRAAAEGSSMIRRCGRHMIEQPPSRRFAALTLGANLFGLILSFGSVQLLGAMVRRANTLEAAGGDAQVQAVRARRLYTAILRGFAMSPGWSPFSVSLAIALSVTPGARWETVMPVAFVTAMLLLALGWLFDIATAPRRRIRAGDVSSGERWTIHLRLVSLIIFIFAVTVALEKSLNIRLLDAVILCVPVIAVCWMLLQSARRGIAVACSLTLRRTLRQVVRVFPTYRMEVTILSSAGFAGTMVAAALPTDLIAAGIRGAHMPPELVPGLIVWLVVIGAQLAMNPIITVAIVAAVLPPPEALGTTAPVVAAAYMTAWGISVGGSPFTLSTLMIASISGKSARFVGHVWNGAYTVVALLLATAWLALLSVLLRG